MSDYENDPEVQAVIRRKQRAKMLETANAQLPARGHGETAYLRNAAEYIDLALTEYDKLSEPPELAHDFAACFDKIVERLTALGAERVKAAANAAAKATDKANRKGRGASASAPA